LFVTKSAELTVNSIALFCVLLALSLCTSASEKAAPVDHSDARPDAAFCPLSQLSDYSKPVVAIIIDDLGYRMQPALDLLTLQTPITFSIIPFTPYGKKMAELAHSQNREIMVHAPMETLEPRPWEPSLNEAMNHQGMLEMSQSMLSAVPYARGLNNHGGSLLTQRQEHMDWLMQILSSEQLYFVDSMTTADSVAGSRAQRAGVMHYQRDVFLDNERDVEAIGKQLAKAETIAQERGYALVIGHPYPETLEVLRTQLPALSERVTFVNVSELLQLHDANLRFAQQTAQNPETTVHPQQQ